MQPRAREVDLAQQHALAAHVGEVGLAQPGAVEAHLAQVGAGETRERPVASDDRQRRERAAVERAADDLAPRERRVEERARAERAVEERRVGVGRGVEPHPAERASVEHRRRGRHLGHVDVDEGHACVRLSRDLSGVPVLVADLGVDGRRLAHGPAVHASHQIVAVRRADGSFARDRNSPTSASRSAGRHSRIRV